MLSHMYRHCAITTITSLPWHLYRYCVIDTILHISAFCYCHILLLPSNLYLCIELLPGHSIAIIPLSMYYGISTSSFCHHTGIYFILLQASHYSHHTCICFVLLSWSYYCHHTCTYTVLLVSSHYCHLCTWNRFLVSLGIMWLPWFLQQSIREDKWRVGIGNLPRLRYVSVELLDHNDYNLHWL